MFCFRAFLAEVTWPWAPNQQAIFWLNFFENRLSSESSEHLIGILAYLKPKLRLKKQNLGKNSSPTKDNFSLFG